MKNILLLLPPFYTPFTPPLGVSILKSYLQKHGYTVKLVDFNINPRLWDMHHQYFDQIDEENSLDGYSLYWYILNAHMLAYVNNADRHQCRHILTTLFDKYSLSRNTVMIEALLGKVEKYFADLKEILLDVGDFAQYHCIGTSTFSTSLASSLFIHKTIKEMSPQVMTLMGGGVFADDLAIGTENLTTLLKEYPYVDKIVVGEGEVLFLKVLRGEFAEQRLISLEDLNNQTLDINESVTPDFSDFQLSRYHHLTIEGSRSCPFQCKFCSERIQWGSYRKKDAKYLAEQLISLKHTYKKKTFFLGDSLINYYINDLSQELLQLNDQVYFDGYLRAEPPIMVRENTLRMAKAGLYRVRLGMESASPNVLKLMDKRITPENMRQCLISLANAGIRTTTYWVIGFPGETEEDFMETYNFIKANHRYIYELEAHPYYYYPTGQGISTDFQYESLYPAELEKFIKFKKYDIKNPVPSREERFSRLKRLSDMCKSLGLYNIYSLQEIYQAEERWFKLSPLAVEIYPGSKTERLPVKKLPVLEQMLQNLKAKPVDEPITMKVMIGEEIDEQILEKAGQAVFAGHDWLSFADFKLETVNLEQIKKVESEDIGGSGVRVILQKGVDSHQLVLIGDRRIIDAKSLAIIAEELFRAYHQMRNGGKVSLLYNELTYGEYLKMLSPGQMEFLEINQSTSNKCAVAGMQSKALDFVNIEVLKKSNISLAEVLAFATAKSLSKVNDTAETTLELLNDYRNNDGRLQNTVGMLSYHTTLANRFTSSNLTEELISFKQVYKTAVKATDSKGQVLLNLTALFAESWLGGNGWQVGEMNRERSINAAVEIVPMLRDSELNLCIYFAEGWQKQAESLLKEIVTQSKILFEYCQAYVQAEEVWLKEFKDYQPKANITLDYQKSHPSTRKNIISCAIEEGLRADVTCMAQSLGESVEVAVLAALQILLSRLAMSDEVVILTSMKSNLSQELFPIRAFPLIHNHYAALVKETARNVEKIKGQRFAVEILGQKYAGVQVFDVGFFAESKDAAFLQNAVVEDLHLAIFMQDGSFTFEYAEDKLAAETVEQLAQYLKTILQNIVKDPYQGIDKLDLIPETEKALLETAVKLDEIEEEFDF